MHLSPSPPFRSPPTGPSTCAFLSLECTQASHRLQGSLHNSAPSRFCTHLLQPRFVSRHRFQRRISHQRTHSTTVITVAKPEPIAVGTSPVEHQAARQDAGRRDVSSCARCLTRFFGVPVLANGRQRTDLQPHNCWRFQETLLKKRRGGEVWRRSLLRMGSSATTKQRRCNLKRARPLT